MKTRIIGSLLVLVVLGLLAAYFNEDQPPRRSPAPSADDSQFKL